MRKSLLNQNLAPPLIRTRVLLVILIFIPLLACVRLKADRPKKQPEDLDREIEIALSENDYDRARNALKRYPEFAEERLAQKDSELRYYYGLRDWNRRMKHYRVLLAALPMLEGNFRRPLIQLERISRENYVPEERDWYRASAYAGLGYLSMANKIALESLANVSIEDEPYLYRWMKLLGCAGWLEDEIINKVRNQENIKSSLSSALFTFWMAKSLLRKGEVHRAAELARDAREIARDVKGAESVGGGAEWVRTMLWKEPGQVVAFEAALLEARCLLRLSSPGKATNVLDTARQFAQEIGLASESIGRTYALRALAEARAGHPDKGLKYCSAAEKYLERTEDNNIRSKICHDLGKAYWALGQEKKGIIWARLGLEIGESVKVRDMPVGVRAEYYARWRESYQGLVAMLIRIGDVKEAFLVAEKGRNRALLETILEHPSKPDLTRKYQELSRQAANFRKELAFGRAKDREPEELRDKLQEVESLIAQEFARQSEIASPAFYHFVHLEELQRLMDRNQMALVYQMLPRRGIAWAVGRDFVIHAFLPSEDEISKYCRLLQAAIADPAQAVKMDESWRSHAIWLYNKLIRPFKGQCELRREWIVIPDGDLVGIPFEVLLDSRTNKSVIDMAEVCYTPSISVLKQLSSPREAVPRSKILLASVSNVPVKSSYPGETRGFDLSALPYVDEEANSIYALFGPQETTWLKNNSASENELKARPLHTFGILHFACHAVMPSDVPWLSEPALVLGTIGDDSTEDGLLMAHEVEQLRLNADLVVLSACETAGGEFVKGSGFIGLSTSFMVAGAKEVLVSQWMVDDKSTALLMKIFYQGITGGKDTAKALRDAKQMLREGGMSREERRGIISVGEENHIKVQDKMSAAHPFFWAPFVLVCAPE